MAIIIITLATARWGSATAARAETSATATISSHWEKNLGLARDLLGNNKNPNKPNNKIEIRLRITELRGKT